MRSFKQSDSHLLEVWVAGGNNLCQFPRNPDPLIFITDRDGDPQTLGKLTQILLGPKAGTAHYQINNAIEIGWVCLRGVRNLRIGGEVLRIPNNLPRIYIIATVFAVMFPFSLKR